MDSLWFWSSHGELVILIYSWITAFSHLIPKILHIQPVPFSQEIFSPAATDDYLGHGNLNSLLASGHTCLKISGWILSLVVIAVPNLTTFSLLGIQMVWKDSKKGESSMNLQHLRNLQCILQSISSRSRLSMPQKSLFVMWIWWGKQAHICHISETWIVILEITFIHAPLWYLQISQYIKCCLEREFLWSFPLKLSKSIHIFIIGIWIELW